MGLRALLICLGAIAASSKVEGATLTYFLATFSPTYPSEGPRHQVSYDDPPLMEEFTFINPHNGEPSVVKASGTAFGLGHGVGLSASAKVSFDLTNWAPGFYLAASEATIVDYLIFSEPVPGGKIEFIFDLTGSAEEHTYARSSLRVPSDSDVPFEDVNVSATSGMFRLSRTLSEDWVPSPLLIIRLRSLVLIFPDSLPAEIGSDFSSAADFNLVLRRVAVRDASGRLMDDLTIRGLSGAVYLAPGSSVPEPSPVAMFVVAALSAVLTKKRKWLIISECRAASIQSKS